MFNLAMKLSVSKLPLFASDKHMCITQYTTTTYSLNISDYKVTYAELNITKEATINSSNPLEVHKTTIKSKLRKLTNSLRTTKKNSMDFNVHLFLAELT